MKVKIYALAPFFATLAFLPEAATAIGPANREQGTETVQ
jgi:hypothetical protein